MFQLSHAPILRRPLRLAFAIFRSSENLDGVPIPHPAVIFLEADVENPVQAILNPVLADRFLPGSPGDRLMSTDPTLLIPGLCEQGERACGTQTGGVW
jgi:hypothetical protein